MFLYPSIDSCFGPKERITLNSNSVMQYQILTQLYSTVADPVSDGTSQAPVKIADKISVQLVFPSDVFNQNEKNKVSSTLLSLRLDAQPTVTY